MNPNDIISTLAESVREGNEESCLACNDCWSNWLAELQDMLEDAEISVEEFCNRKEGRIHEDVPIFVVKRNRLRLRGNHTCVNLRVIRMILEGIVSES